MSQHKRVKSNETRSESITPSLTNTLTVPTIPAACSQELHVRPASLATQSRLDMGRQSVPVLGRVGGSAWSRERQAVRSVEELERLISNSVTK